MSEDSGEYDIEIIPPTRWKRKLRYYRAMMPHWMRLLFWPSYRRLWRMVNDAK